MKSKIWMTNLNKWLNICVTDDNSFVSIIEVLIVFMSVWIFKFEFLLLWICVFSPINLFVMILRECYNDTYLPKKIKYKYNLKIFLIDSIDITSKSKFFFTSRLFSYFKKVECSKSMHFCSLKVCIRFEFSNILASRITEEYALSKCESGAVTLVPFIFWCN